MGELSEFEKNTIKTVEKDGRTTIKCRKGLWAVSAPNKTQATAEAVHYFMQYWQDGEYAESKADKFSILMAEFLCQKQIKKRD